MPRRRKTDDTWIVIVFILVIVTVVLTAFARWVVATPALLPITALVLIAVGLLSARRRAARRAVAAQQAQIRDVQSQEIARYHVMDPRQFEDAIAYLCHRDGCRDARRVGGAGDLGADVTAIAPDGRRIVIQCKRYGPTTNVGSPDLQKFGGTCYAVHGAQVAAVVTTSRFTKPAIGYAQSIGIHLFDQHALAAWASRTGPAPWMLDSANPHNGPARARR
ncbi:restriction endonuclease [Streptomyces sp. NPDC001914]|uniref:restriction endonuclease n=1 Tax=Streptomyces sp. NPDC001914 TaxID=3364623 RepID=UPI00367593F7